MSTQRSVAAAISTRLLAGAALVWIPCGVEAAHSNGGGHHGGNGNGGGSAAACPAVEQLVNDLSGPDDDKRLHACRALRQQPWDCGNAPNNSSSSAGSSESEDHKLKILSATAAPDPFSPEPDGFLDTTTLQATIDARRTDGANGENSSRLEQRTEGISFEIDATWTLFSSTSAAPVRILSATLPITFPHAAASGQHGNGPASLTTSLTVVWDGRSETGAVQDDGTYPYTLEVDYLRIELPGAGRAMVGSGPRAPSTSELKVIASATLQGAVTIDESVGEGLRQTVEQALIARLSDSDVSVRRAAIATLAVVGREASIPPLEATLAGQVPADDPVTDGFAAVALIQLQRLTGQDTESFLSSALTTSQSSITRALIIRALGISYDTSLVSSLVAIRDDSNEPAVVSEAARRAVITLQMTVEAP